MISRLRRLLVLTSLLAAANPAAWAHLGSKDVFETVSAGPYKLFVTIRPPDVIPGVASVEVRSSGAMVMAIAITPIPLTGEASKHPPTADAMKRSNTDPAFYTGAVWMMANGSWQVRFDVEGSAGHQTTAIPVPAVALTTLHMQPAMGAGLAVLGLFLLVSMAGVITAAVRESRLPPGALPTPERNRRSVYATSTALAVMLLAVFGGAQWWNAEAATYARNVYRPMTASATLTGNTLDLRFTGTPDDLARRRPGRRIDDLLPDHGKLIHLYAIRQPGMDAAFHLHPTLAAPGDFRMELPAMPPGSYTLYGDIVHASGFPETLVTRLDIPPNLPASSLGKDDALALSRPMGEVPLGATYKLPDGYTMHWERPDLLTAGAAYQLQFDLRAPDGSPARDMQPYLGMAGHAAFVKADGTVFAHTHPEGTAPMPALALANGGMQMASTRQDGKPVVDFPYGFPTSGVYRIFIQMKHGETVETGVFDAIVR